MDATRCYHQQKKGKLTTKLKTNHKQAVHNKEIHIMPYLKINDLNGNEFVKCKTIMDTRHGSIYIN